MPFGLNEQLALNARNCRIIPFCNHKKWNCWNSITFHKRIIPTTPQPPLGPISTLKPIPPHHFNVPLYVHFPLKLSNDFNVYFFHSACFWLKPERKFYSKNFPGKKNSIYAMFHCFYAFFSLIVAFVFSVWHHRHFQLQKQTPFIQPPLTLLFIQSVSNTPIFSFRFRESAASYKI